MKKSTLLAVAAAVAAIALLSALAIYIRKEQLRLEARSTQFDNPLESDANSVSGAGSGSKDAHAASAADTASPSLTASGSGAEDDTAAEETEDETYDITNVTDRSKKAQAAVDEALKGEELPEHQIIFFGDSRTLGMRDALKKAERDDDCVYVGKVGEGNKWASSDGTAELASAIAAYPDLPVVVNFGVNDPDQIDQYIDTYTTLFDSYPDTDFYIMSINPIDMEVMEEYYGEDTTLIVNESNVETLNKTLRETWPDRWLDCCTFLRLLGYETVDGLHYTTQTYLDIHDFVVRELFAG